MTTALRAIRAIIIALAVGFVGHVTQAQEVPSCAEHLPFGVPTVPAGLTTTLVCHAGYAALVDDEALVPRWVAYHLTGAHTLGCLERGNNFHADANLPAGHRARPADYAKSGFDIGHQAPAQDFGWDEGEMSDSFSLANMAPQLPGLNRQEWERGEETVRAWAVQRGDLLVYVGPVLHGAEPTIGPDHVAVPSAFWKVIVDVGAGKAVAWEMPQKDIPKGDLTPWLVTVAQVERDAGISLPLPAAVDPAAPPQLWPADIGAWSKAHKAACGR
jgi:endonuclease G